MFVWSLEGIRESYLVLLTHNLQVIMTKGLLRDIYSPLKVVQLEVNLASYNDAVYYRS